MQHYDGQGLEVIGVEAINVMISEDGRRVWVCTEKGTVLRAKIGSVEGRVTVDDKRLVNDGSTGYDRVKALRDEAERNEESGRADIVNDALLIMLGREPGDGWAP